MSAGASPPCPQCGSKKLWRDGLRYSPFGDRIQRWLCRNCGLRFSDPRDVQRALSAFERVERVDTKAVKGRGDKALECQICVEETKNFAATELKTVAGEIGKQQQGTILDYAWKLKKRGLAESTIKNRTYRLNILVEKGADLTNPDSVETVLATEKWTPSNKSESVAAYRSFTKTFNIPWTPIKVRYEPKQPFIPLESEIDQLIAGCGKRTATFLQVLKDTGARAGEITKLQWTDVNSQNNTISINDPEKGSKSRTVKVSAKTIAMTNAMSKKYGNYIFNPRVQAIQDSFWRSRMKLARTLQNPRLLQIHFHTLRHFKATMEYHRTRNILYVKQLLGHKRLENTEIYTHLIEFENDEYHSATAKTIEEAKQLIETGFEYVTEMEDIKLFRKRK
jgi:integrase